MPMNNRLLVPRKVPGLLDLVPGAAAAYSLRSLSNSYAGPVVTVRRSTDSAEADFTASEVSDGTLAGWAGADGFVKQWWDQSGNARHATQATTTAQPQIVDSGVLVTEGGKAAVQFDGVDDFLLVNGVFTANALISLFVVVSSANVTSEQYITDNSNSGSYGGGYSLRFLSSGGFRFWAQSALYNASGGTSENGQQYLLSAINTSTTTGTSSLAVDGALAATAVLSASTRDAKSTTRIGHSQLLGGYLNGTVQELIAYPADQTALRTRIEGNLAWYY